MAPPSEIGKIDVAPPTPPIGVCLLYMGGPSAISDVKPFLRQLFSDREIIQLPGGRLMQGAFAAWISARRAPKVQRYYKEIGGGSPLIKITTRQMKHLGEALSAHGNFHLTMAMRYCPPRADQAVAELQSAGIERLVTLPLYPQYSRATTGSSVNDFKVAMERAGMSWDLVPVASFHDHPGYLDALTATVRVGLQELGEEDEGNKCCVVFSAHSLPQRMIDEGDPYERQVNHTVTEVVQRLALTNWRLGFQSRSGPVQWLQPDTVALVDELLAQGQRRLLVVPVSFVSDHIETLHEIDIRLRQHCMERGCEAFVRAPSLNDSPAFINALAKIVLKACQINH